MEELKSLKEMSLEELWHLFPVTLVPYNPSWVEWAEEEITLLQTLLQSYHPTISHIGSTSIKGIYSKPTVDILVETVNSDDWNTIVEIMESKGYILMAWNEGRMSFNKGYTPDGYADKVFHIHFHLSGDRDEIIFRDYLNAHPIVVKEYEVLKKSLLAKYMHDRDGYTAAKSDFVSSILSLAKTEKCLASLD